MSNCSRSPSLARPRSPEPGRPSAGRRRNRRWLPAIAGFALLLSGANPAVAAPGEVPVGATLPATKIRGLNGPDRLLTDLAGRPLIINVWASWCGPCRAESASLERLAWLDGGQHFAVIGISTDDDTAQAKAWLRHSNATISHYIDQELVLEHLLGASRLPLTVLVGADGRVLDRVHGAREWDSLESRRYLAEVFRNPAIAVDPPGRNR